MRYVSLIGWTIASPGTLLFGKAWVGYKANRLVNDSPTNTTRKGQADNRRAGRLANASYWPKNAARDLGCKRRFCAVNWSSVLKFGPRIFAKKATRGSSRKNSAYGGYNTSFFKVQLI